MRCLLLVVLLASGVAWAQSPTDSTAVPADTTASDTLRVSADVDRANLPPETELIDVRVLRRVYEQDTGAMPVIMNVANETAYPAYWSATPLLLGGTLLTDADTRPAIRLALTQLGTFGTTYLAKRLVHRPRPYISVDGIAPRDRQHQDDEVFDPYSFPSGHTSSAFAIATSLSSSYPKWYVIVPSMAWATTVGVSRVWLGVHYPSDVLVGAGIGAGTAILVHLLLPDSEDDLNLEGASAPIVAVAIPL